MTASATRKSWSNTILGIIGLAFLLLMCVGCLSSKCQDVETLAYARGIVDLCDDATALLTRDAALMEARGIGALTAEEMKERLLDWRIIRDRAAKVLIEAPAALPSQMPKPAPATPDWLDEDEVID